jgi:hypothetical protein
VEDGDGLSCENCVASETEDLLVAVLAEQFTCMTGSLRVGVDVGSYIETIERGERRDVLFLWTSIRE